MVTTVPREFLPCRTCERERRLDGAMGDRSAGPPRIQTWKSDLSDKAGSAERVKVRLELRRFPMVTGYPVRDVVDG